MTSGIIIKLRKLKKILNQINFKNHHLIERIKINKKWYGNDYGGFYIYQKLLNPDSIVYSFGIGEDISFDNAVIKNHKCYLYAFDPTPKSINWIKSKTLSSNFTFFEYGIAEKSGTFDFFLPKNTNNISGSYVFQNSVDSKQKIKVEMRSFSDIVDDLGHNHVDVLKMDIEGAEYAVLESILNNPINIPQILIEFHDRLFLDGREKTKNAIMRLRDYNYEIFGVSNSLQEISFINKNFV